MVMKVVVVILSIVFLTGCTVERTRSQYEYSQVKQCESFYDDPVERRRCEEMLGVFFEGEY